MDYLRAFSIVLVVMCHVDGSSLPKAFTVALRDGTVFFVFIAGFLFRHLGHGQIPVLELWRRKAERLVIPYLVACLPGLAMAWWPDGKEFTRAFVVNTIATGVGHRNDAHWFVPCIVLIFYAFPVWSRLTAHPRTLTVVTAVSLAVSLVTFRPAGGYPALSMVHFFGIFMAGVWAASNGNELMRFLERRFWIVVGIGCGCAALVIPFQVRTNSLTMEDVLVRGIIAVDLVMLGKVLLVLPLLSIFQRMAAKHQPAGWVRLLARMSFGIFIWHLYVFNMIGRLAERLGVEGTIWVAVAQAIVTIPLLLGLLVTAKKISPRLGNLVGAA